MRRMPAAYRNEDFLKEADAVTFPACCPSAASGAASTAARPLMKARRWTPGSSRGAFPRQTFQCERARSDRWLHGRFTEWSAHPRRSATSVVDDRILTSCAAVRARMDGWRTLAVRGNCFTNYLEDSRRASEVRLDTEDRSHGSITWSARSSSDGAMVRASALAVLRLITSSNLFGCSMGRSPGLAPLRILSTKIAARWK
jgi:hypothetical protein